MSFSSKAKAAVLTLLGLSIVTVVAATVWLLKPTWEAYREQVKFEEAVKQLRVDDEQSVEQASMLARQTGLPAFAEAELIKANSVLVPFYLRAYWYCVYRGPTTRDADDSPPGGGATPSTQVYRLEIPLDHYQPQTDYARKLVSRVGQVEVRNTPVGPAEEPALPLEGEEARRVAFIADFLHVISGKANGNLGIHYELIHANPAP